MHNSAVIIAIVKEVIHISSKVVFVRTMHATSFAEPLVKSHCKYKAK